MLTSDLQYPGCLVSLIRGPFIKPKGNFSNEPTPAIGLAYLAGSLKKAGFPVFGLDASGEALGRLTPIENSNLQYYGLSTEEILERVPPKTKVIGISMMFSSEWTFNKKLAAALKTKFPHAVIIGGGEHVTAIPEYCLRDCPALDYCALGEGEGVLVKFCEKIASGQNPKEIQGIAYLENNQFIKTAPMARIKNLDDIPWPDWELFPVRPYLDQAAGWGPSFGRSMPMLATRGCPYQCTFCSNPAMWTTRYYMRSVENVIQEIQYYKEKFNIQGIQFYDLTAIVQKQWTKDFCAKMIEEKINLPWSLPAGTRSEALDEENLSLMAQSNCRYLVYAPESGSEETLKLIKKKIALGKMKESIRSAVKYGIVLRTNMILGFPHETRRRVWETLKTQLEFAIMGVDEVPLFAFQPYPGTELFDYLAQKNRIRLNDDFFDSLANFGVKFSVPAATYCENVGKVELHIYRLLFGYILTYFLSYLLRPGRIIRTIRNLLTKDRSSTVFEQRIKDRLRKLKPVTTC